ncbi:MAG TPA: hypothetical protein V6C95_11240 [Coleofasciculaceae cyanobacterium]
MDLEIARTRCKESLIQSIKQLQGVVQLEQIEAIADLITQTMKGPWRYFHTNQHIFEVGESGDAIEVLAALFHDLVYVQVDHGIGINISRYIAPFVHEVQGQIMIRDSQDLPNSLPFAIVSAVFGFQPGQALPPMSGQNEFLSAAIAGFCLEPFLTSSQIAQIAACIEATVPFRPLSPSGLTPIEMLHQRLINVNKQFNLGWSDEETIDAVKRSVRLVNRDVENFADSRAAHFLDNTWNLMPETNHELMNPSSYTVSGYRWSLQRMEGFLTFLTPERVFQQFRGEPDEETYQAILQRTGKNLEVAKLYLGCKLISIGIIEALSTRLGRDIAVSMMMGEFPTPGLKTPALEDFLPTISTPKEPGNELERVVLELLSEGRNQDSPYDLKNSPIATFIVKSIGFNEMKRLIDVAKNFFTGKISPSEFLCECDPDVVNAITVGVRKLFECRAARFSWTDLKHNGSVSAVSNSH